VTCGSLKKSLSGGSLMRRRNILGLIALFCCLGCPLANADILVTNLGEPDNPNGPTTVGNTPGGADDQVWGAQSFVTGVALWDLTSIDAQMGNATGGGIPVIAQLRADTGTNEIDMSAGGLIATFNLPSLTGANSARNFSLNASELLAPNTKYWFMIGIDAGDTTNTFLWDYSNTGSYSGSGSLAEFGQSIDAGATWTYPNSPYFPWKIQVNGSSAVPEPNTCLFCCVGLIALAVGRRRKCSR
jgi:hypothetical protein